MLKPQSGPGFFAALISVGLALLAVACSKNDDAQKPAGFPAPAPGTAPPAVMPAPAAPVAAPTTLPALPAAEAPAAEPKSDPNAVIKGEIVLAPAMKSAVKPDDVVFLVARRVSDNPSERGSLVAVKKFTAASFPIPFSLGPEDMMFKNGAFEGDLTLSARVDKDGDPMSHKKGDVIAMLPKVHVGSRTVKLRLDQLQKEDESLIGGGAAAPMMGGGSPHGQLPPGHP